MSDQLLGIIVGGAIGIFGAVIGAFCNHWLTLRRDSQTRMIAEREKLRQQITSGASDLAVQQSNKTIYRKPIDGRFSRKGRETMSKGRDRIISRRPDGTWENKRNDADRASSLHKTQREAEQAAKDMLRKQGGGELTIKAENGKIRSKDTIAPGNDPFPPKDKEH